MTRDEIESKLEPHILNVSLAALAGKVGDLRTVKGMLVDEVAKIAKRAQHSGCFCPHCNPQ